MPDAPRRDNEPDYRFTLANERTFLAWVRTCLALLAGAVAIVQFAPELGSEAFREVAALVLAGLAALASAGGLVRWYVAQRAMSQGRGLRRGVLPLILAVSLALVALAVFAVLVRELSR